VTRVKTWMLFILFAVIGGAAYWFMGDITNMISSTGSVMPSLKTVGDTWNTVSKHPLFPIALTGVTVAGSVAGVFSHLYSTATKKAKEKADKELAEASRQGIESVSQTEAKYQGLTQQYAKVQEENVILRSQTLDSGKFTELLDQKQRELDRVRGDLASAERTIRELKTIQHEYKVP